MMEPLRKFGRALRRDYMDRAARYCCGSAVPAGVALGVAGVGAGSILPAAIAGVIFSGILAGCFAACAEIGMRRKKEIDLGFVVQDGIGYFARLTGPGKKISVVHNTQKLLDRMAKKHACAAQLPPEVIKKFAPYLKDAEEAAAGVKAVVPQTPIELPKFEFIREYFNAAGAAEKEVVAAIALPYTPAPWELERLAQEAEARHRAMVAQAGEDVFKGTSQPILVKRLSLKRKAAPSR